MYSHEELISAVSAAGRDGKTFTVKDVRTQLGFDSRDKKELSRFRRRLRAFEKAASDQLEKLGNNSYRLRTGAFENAGLAAAGSPAATTAPAASASPESIAAPSSATTSAAAQAQIAAPTTEAVAASKPDVSAAQTTEAVATTTTKAGAAQTTKAVVAPKPEASAAQTTETVAASKPGASAAQTPEAVAATKPEASAAPTTEAVVAPTTEAVAASKPEVSSAPTTEAVDAPTTEAVAASKPEATAAPVPEAIAARVAVEEPVSSKPEPEVQLEPASGVFQSAVAANEPEAQAKPVREAPALHAVEPLAAASEEPPADHADHADHADQSDRAAYVATPPLPHEHSVSTPQRVLSVAGALVSSAFAASAAVSGKVRERGRNLREQLWSCVRSAPSRKHAFARLRGWAESVRPLSNEVREQLSALRQRVLAGRRRAA